MRTNDRGADKSPSDDEDDGQITIDARDVLAGHYDRVRLEARR